MLGMAGMFSNSKPTPTDILPSARSHPWPSSTGAYEPMEAILVPSTTLGVDQAWTRLA